MARLVRASWGRRRQGVTCATGSAVGQVHVLYTGKVHYDFLKVSGEVQAFTDVSF